MRERMRKLFAPILNQFESGEGVYVYKASHRTILILVGVLFLAISLVSLIVMIKASEFGGIIPVVVFLFAGIVCEVVGLLGSNQAVARIWKSK